MFIPKVLNMCKHIIDFGWCTMKKISILGLILILLLVGCENIDLSKLSDNDLERISNKLIVCPSNYMRFGSSCCIDYNPKNGFCDRDERELTDDEKEEESLITEEIAESDGVLEEANVIEITEEEVSKEFSEEPDTTIMPLPPSSGASGGSGGEGGNSEVEESEAESEPILVE